MHHQMAVASLEGDLDINVMLLSACLVINPITVDSFASLFESETQ